MECKGIAFARLVEEMRLWLYFCSKYKKERMNWLLLIIAGLLEIGFSISLIKMKETNGWLFWEWTGLFLFFLFVSLWLMYKAVETIPVGTAYAVWTGIGSVGTVIVGILFFREPATFWRLFFISTLILSLIGLKLVSD